MVGASKILTVSYGTFSCTLEGFDDAFGTMKAIAEYFRDLASEDRYFGAVPPTPDAEMLQRIAEREIQRRVETRLQANGIHLRASVGEVAATAPAPADATPTPHLLVDPVVPAPSPAGEPEDEGEIVAVSPVVAMAPSQNESVAAKLARIRAMVARNRSEPLPAAVAVASASGIATPDAVLAADIVADSVALDDAPAALTQLEITDTMEDAAFDGSEASVLEQTDLYAVTSEETGDLVATETGSYTDAAPQETGADPVWSDEEAEVEALPPAAEAETAKDEPEPLAAAAHETATEEIGAEFVAELAEPLADGFDDDIAVEDEDAPELVYEDKPAMEDIASPVVAEAAPEHLPEDASVEIAVSEDVRAADFETTELSEDDAAPATLELEPEEVADWQVAEAQADVADMVEEVAQPADETALIFAALAEANAAEEATLDAEAPALDAKDEDAVLADLVLGSVVQDDTATEPETSASDIDAAILEAMGIDVAAPSAIEEAPADDLAAEAALAAALRLESATQEQDWQSDPDEAQGHTPALEDDVALQPMDERLEEATAELVAEWDQDDAIAASAAAEPLADEPETLAASVAERARGRVLVVKRADFATDPSAAIAAALDSGDHSATSPDVRASSDGELAAMLAGAELAPEDEAQLIEALAELEEELAGPTADDASSIVSGILADDSATFDDEAFGATAEESGTNLEAVHAEDAAVRQRDGRAREDGASAPPEDEISRLVETANSRLEGAENKRRMSAIAHLKAAVAATVADRKLSFRRGDGEAEADSELDRYRDDLSRVVQPRRASSQGTDRRPETPAARPAPLVLVSEQRIDGGQQERPAEPPSILPRRISASAVAVEPVDEDDEDAEFVSPVSAEEAGSFAEFAEAAGAKELPDLLEAAAAYIAIHEGLTHFSRPQVMRKVAAVSSDDFTREQGLQSFGKLLRQGRIQKVRRGQFTISKTSRFTPQSRGAAR